MKQNIILFHPKTGHEKNYKFFWIPYSLLSIGSELANKGHRVQIIDNNLENVGEKEFGELVKKITSEKPSLVGISSMIGYQIKEGLAFAKSIRDYSPNTPIVWGGTAPTILSKEFVESSLVDIIVKGQGEITAVELANCLENKQDLKTISGIWYRKNNEITQNPDRALYPKTSFSRYNFNLVRTQDYIRNDENINNKVLNHISSQGCPFPCGFCSEVAISKRKWYAQAPERTLEEVIQLVEDYGANGIKFYDANFFTNKNRVLQISKGLLERQLPITWAASAHPKNILSFDEDELRLIRESGCSRILIGAESGNQAELDYIKKNMTTEDVLNTAKKLASRDIHGSFTIMVGYPGFSEDNADKTLEFGVKITKISPIHEVKAHIYAPYPGTPLYTEAIKAGFIPPRTLEDWANYDYYEVQTPWLKKDLTKKVRDFNKEHCPYVL